MIAAEIYSWLFHLKQFDGSLFSIDNVYLFQFESDFLSVSRSGYMTEYEVKVSRADFKADLVKESYIHSERKKRLKHEMLTEGYEGLKYFNFIAPPGVIPPELVPAHCGLIEIHKEGNNWNRFNTIIKAPQLPGAKKITEEQKTSIISKYQWRYSGLKIKVLDEKVKSAE